MTTRLDMLVIGNSFSNNATRFLPDLAEAAGVTLHLEHCSLGGCSLERHWQHAAAFERDPDDFCLFARPYAGDRSLQQALSSRPWDVVSIQQASFLSYLPETYHPYADRLHDLIRRLAPGAEVVIHQTWAYRADDPIYVDEFTPEDMHTLARNNYHALAAKLGCRLLPVGDAFERARLDAEWGGRFPDQNFDRETAVYPQMPEARGSLHAGFRWTCNEQGAWSLAYDGHHANAAGEYLGGCVWLGALFGQAVDTVTHAPEVLAPERAAALRRIAQETVEHKI